MATYASQQKIIDHLLEKMTVGAGKQKRQVGFRVRAREGHVFVEFEFFIGALKMTAGEAEHFAAALQTCARRCVEGGS